jgi:hypothetical protein
MLPKKRKRIKESPEKLSVLVFPSRKRRLGGR